MSKLLVIEVEKTPGEYVKVPLLLQLVTGLETASKLRRQHQRVYAQVGLYRCTLGSYTLVEENVKFWTDLKKGELSVSYVYMGKHVRRSLLLRSPWGLRYSQKQIIELLLQRYGKYGIENFTEDFLSQFTADMLVRWLVGQLLMLYGYKEPVDGLLALSPILEFFPNTTGKPWAGELRDLLYFRDGSVRDGKTYYEELLRTNYRGDEMSCIYYTHMCDSAFNNFYCLGIRPYQWTDWWLDFRDRENGGWYDKGCAWYEWRVNTETWDNRVEEEGLLDMVGDELRRGYMLQIANVRVKTNHKGVKIPKESVIVCHAIFGTVDYRF
jgi:hypothetical protein